MHQLYLFSRISTRHGNNRRAQILYTIVQAQTSGKQPVTERDMKYIVLIRTISRQTTSYNLSPSRQILASISYDSRTTGRPRRSMQTHNLRHRNCKKPKGVIISQILFCRKREFDDIINTIYIVRGYSQFLHFLTIKRSIMINSFYGLPQPDSL